MSRTITGTIGTLVSLTLASDDPATIDAAGVLEAGPNGNARRAWEIRHLGTGTHAAAL